MSKRTENPAPALKFIPELADELGEVLIKFEKANDDGNFDFVEKIDVGDELLDVIKIAFKKSKRQGIIQEFRTITEEQKKAETDRFEEKFNLKNDDAEQKIEQVYALIFGIVNFIEPSQK